MAMLNNQMLYLIQDDAFINSSALVTCSCCSDRQFFAMRVAIVLWFHLGMDQYLLIPFLVG